MSIEALRCLADQVFNEGEGRSAGEVTHPMPRLTLLRRAHPSALEAMLYEPLICLILRGRKEISQGERTLSVGAGECLLVSHDLPVISRITEASPGAPYLALVLSVDLALLRGLYEELAEDLDWSESGSLEKSAADPELSGALARYLGLRSSPVSARVLGPAALREIHFRLLLAPAGGMLRSLLQHDSHASQIARAIASIRRDFRADLAVPALARSVGMSASAFHKHFKAITATTPLQYQKDLQLMEARRLLARDGQSVSAVAYAVGYESPTQFSREFARKFGHPPSHRVGEAV